MYIHINHIYMNLGMIFSNLIHALLYPQTLPVLTNRCHQLKLRNLEQVFVILSLIVCVLFEFVFQSKYCKFFKYNQLSN